MVFLIDDGEEAGLLGAEGFIADPARSHDAAFVINMEARGTTGTPFTGTLTNFVRQVLSQQGEAATSAQQLSDGQGVVLNTLKQKVTATSGVNIDDEMAHLLALQNAYSANARVMSTVKDMYTALLQAM